MTGELVGPYLLAFQARPGRRLWRCKDSRDGDGGRHGKFKMLCAERYHLSGPVYA